MKKYFLRFTAGLILASMLFLTGCGDTDNSVTYNDEDRVIGTLHGVVTDANTNERMVNVVVKVVQKDLMFTTKTDSLGYYIVKNLYSGNYEVTFHTNGYAVSRSYGYIPTVAEVTNSKLDLNFSEVLDMDLFTLTADVSGKIYKVIENGNIVPASGVKVIADFNHFDLSPDEYTATTNTNGYYYFTNLPSTPTVMIRTLPYSDGTYSFDPTGELIDLFDDLAVVAPEMGLTITEAPVFVVTHNLQDGFVISDNAVLSFNKAIDPNTFKVYLGQAKSEITSVVWSNGNTTVTINPDENLLLETEYEIYLMGKSADGNEFGYSFGFETQPGIDVVRTSFQPYDEYNELQSSSEAMQIYFSETVKTTDSVNYFRVDGVNVTPSWTNNVLSLNLPTGVYSSGDTFILTFRVKSVLADYDIISGTYQIHIK